MQISVLIIPYKLRQTQDVNKNRSWLQMWLTCFSILALVLKFGIFTRNFKISFVILHWFSNHCYLPYIIPRRAPMGSIWRPSGGTGRGDLHPRVFIKFINGMEPMANDFWFHGLDGLSCDVHHTARFEIPAGTDWKFITDYVTYNGRHIIIIRKSSVNGSVQFTGITEGVCPILPMLPFQLQTEGGVGLGQL